MCRYSFGSSCHMPMPKTVILLQIVMVSRGTHLVKNDESLAVHNQWVPIISKKKRSLNWKCLGLYVTRQLIWGQTPKLFIQFAIQGDDRLWSSNADPLLCLSQNKVMFLLKIILIYDKLLWMLPRGWQLNEGSTVVRSKGFLILSGACIN